LFRNFNQFAFLFSDSFFSQYWSIYNIDKLINQWFIITDYDYMSYHEK